jgi:hypothetical protein
VYRKLKDPSGRRYLLQAAPSGFVAWSGITAQSVTGWALHTCGTYLVNRLVFRGGWTVTAWQGDEIAPKRRRVHRRRCRTQAEAVVAMNELAVGIARTGLPRAAQVR